MPSLTNLLVVAAIATTFGQLIVAAASIADFGAIILLSIFFSGEGGTGSTLLLLGALFGLAAVLLGVVRGAERSRRIRADLLRLQDTTAQIRVRAALVLFVGFAALAHELGLEVILGTFIAGSIISLVDHDQVMTHPDFRRKLEAAGFGVFIPAFFVTSGVRFHLLALIFAFVSSARRARWTPLAIVPLLVAIIWLGSPWTGASLNPAGSEGAALAFGDVRDLWIYFAAPCAAALVTGLLWRCNARHIR